MGRVASHGVVHMLLLDLRELSDELHERRTAGCLGIPAQQQGPVHLFAAPDVCVRNAIALTDKENHIFGAHVVAVWPAAVLKDLNDHDAEAPHVRRLRELQRLDRFGGLGKTNHTPNRVLTTLLQKLDFRRVLVGTPQHQRC